MSVSKVYAPAPGFQVYCQPMMTFLPSPSQVSHLSKPLSCFETSRAEKCFCIHRQSVGVIVGWFRVKEIVLWFQITTIRRRLSIWSSVHTAKCLKNAFLKPHTHIQECLKHTSRHSLRQRRRRHIRSCDGGLNNFRISWWVIDCIECCFEASRFSYWDLSISIILSLDHWFVHIVSPSRKLILLRSSGLGLNNM